MTGLPFVLFVLALVVWSVCLLIGTLGSLDTRGDESDGDGGEW